MAQVLGLNNTTESDGTILREVKCRVWWTLVMADNWCSAGLGLPRQIFHKQGQITLDLPSDEIAFQRLPVDYYGRGRVESSREGLWAHSIRLVEILGPIHELNYTLADSRTAESAADGAVSELAQRLDHWHKALPNYMLLSDENMEIYRSHGMGGPFIALHVGHHHYSTLLYFRYLDSTRRNDNTTAQEFARRCKLHASTTSRLLRKSREQSGLETVQATVAQVAVVSSAVLLHSLLYSDASELPQTKSDLSSNFELLIELKQYWPCVDHLVSTSVTLACWSH